MRFTYSVVLAGLCVSSLGWSQVEDDLRTYVESRKEIDRTSADETRALIADIQALRIAAREAVKPPPPDEVRKLEENLASLKVEKLLMSKLNGQIRDKISKDQLVAVVEKMKGSDGDKEIAIDGTAFKIKGHVADGGKKIEFSLSLDTESASYAEMTKGLKDVKLLNARAFKNAFDQKIGQVHVVETKEAITASPDNRKAQLDVVLDRITRDEQQPSTRYKTILAARVNSELEDYGTDTPKNGVYSATRLGIAKSELKEKTDSKERLEKQKEQLAKIKVAEWLRLNNPKDMESCDIMIKAVGFKDLPKEEKILCADKDPAKIAKESEAEAGKSSKAGEASDSNSDPQEEQKRAEEFKRRQAALAQEMAGLRQHCDMIAQRNAALVATEKMIAPINKIYEYITENGKDSEFFVQLVGPRSEADAFFNGGGDDVTEAVKLVGKTPKNNAGNDKLKEERDIVARIMKNSYLSVERTGTIMAGAINAQGMFDPALLQGADEKVRKMADFHNKAKMLLGVIDAELAARDAGNKNRFRPLGGSTTGDAASGGLPVSGVPMAADGSANGISGGSGNQVASPGGSLRPADQRRVDKSKGPRKGSSNKPNYLGR